MIELEIPINVPENRQVTLTLPPEVPTGPTKLHVSVGEWAVDAIPLEFPPRPTHPDLAREYDAFRAMLPELLKNHRGQYVAIHNGKVVANGASEVGTLNAASKSCGSPWSYVGLVTDEPQPLERIRGPREIRGNP
jgi:uncharacterized protein DUF5678